MAPKKKVTEDVEQPTAHEEPRAVVTNASAVDDESVLSGHFCDVVAGKHEGRYGVLLDIVQKDKDGNPQLALVRSRDEHDEMMVVPYKDLRPAQAGRR